MQKAVLMALGLAALVCVAAAMPFEGPEEDCETCIFVFDSIKKHIDEPGWVEKAEKVAHKACGLLPEFKSICNAMLNQYAPQIEEHIRETPSRDLCVETKACKPAVASDIFTFERPVSPVRTLLWALMPTTTKLQSLLKVFVAPAQPASVTENDLQCDTCVQVITVTKDHLKNDPNFRPNCHKLAAEACQLVPEITEMCMMATDEYLDALLDHIRDTPAKKVCKEAEMC